MDNQLVSLSYFFFTSKSLIQCIQALQTQQAPNFGLWMSVQCLSFRFDCSFILSNLIFLSIALSPPFISPFIFSLFSFYSLSLCSSLLLLAEFQQILGCGLLNDKEIIPQRKNLWQQISPKEARYFQPNLVWVNELISPTVQILVITRLQSIQLMLISDEVNR